MSEIRGSEATMSFHSFMAGLHWIAVAAGGFMLCWTLMLFVMTNCGKNATHLRPLFCGSGTHTPARKHRSLARHLMQTSAVI